MKTSCGICGDMLTYSTEIYCHKCCDELYEQYYEDLDQHMVQVTREMAMDACDRTLEGITIKW